MTKLHPYMTDDRIDTHMLCQDLDIKPYDLENYFFSNGVTVKSLDECFFYKVKKDYLKAFCASNAQKEDSFLGLMRRLHHQIKEKENSTVQKTDIIFSALNSVSLKTISLIFNKDGKLNSVPDNLNSLIQEYFECENDSIKDSKFYNLVEKEVILATVLEE
jgi:hypothetical protein